MDTYVILGAGVIGLTTAHEVKNRYPSARVVVVAKHLPGDLDKAYTSPWAGANWQSFARDNGPEEERDAITYRRFAQLVAEGHKEAGITPMDVRVFYDAPQEQAGVFSTGTSEIWFNRLVPGGVRYLPKDLLPEGASFGFDFASFVINTQKYLPWLQTTALQKGVEIIRASVGSLGELFEHVPGAKAYFNCTGLGALSLSDVTDSDVFPVRGQILLVETPKIPLERMYVRGSTKDSGEPTYIFPRGDRSGIILGGCMQPNNWDGDVDPALAERIKKRCCALAPELGKPEDLKIIQHGVGLRPSRNGGARIEKETVNGSKVIHPYGVGGAGYQTSWGSAKEAVDLLQTPSRL